MEAGCCAGAEEMGAAGNGWETLTQWGNLGECKWEEKAAGCRPWALETPRF